MIDLYHPELGVVITVPDESAWVRLRNGWEYAVAVAPDDDPVEQAPILYHEAEYNEEDTWLV